MNAFRTLWRREMSSYFLSPIAYVITVFFLVFMGCSFQFLAHRLTDGIRGATVMTALFGDSIFFWIALLMTVPMITMRLIAEERRNGTFEALVTAPVTEATVVFAKYTGALTFFALMWLPTAAYVFILRAFSPLAAPPDFGPLAAGFLGAFLLGAFFLAVGLLTSSLTRSQIGAAVSSFVLVFLFFLSGFLPYVARDERLQHVAEYFSPIAHMMDFARGTVDSRALVFYAVNTAWVLFATVRVLEARKYR